MNSCNGLSWVPSAAARGARFSWRKADRPIAESIAWPKVHFITAQVGDHVRFNTKFKKDNHERNTR
jgi:hypothetical protein